MKMTEKAIARAAGYRVYDSYASYLNMNLDWNNWYYWKDLSGDGERGANRFLTEQEAYADCCKVNGLTHE